jgi:hypothetical protein
MTRPIPKPPIAAVLAAWKQIYDALLAELADDPPDDWQRSEAAHIAVDLLRLADLAE